MIAAGRRADLVLLDRSPLEDIAHAVTLAGVMVHGRRYSRDDLEAFLDAVVRNVNP